MRQGEHQGCGGVSLAGQHANPRLCTATHHLAALPHRPIASQRASLREVIGPQDSEPTQQTTHPPVQRDLDTDLLDRHMSGGFDLSFIPPPAQREYQLSYTSTVGF
jgi:hypothetical protein